MNDFENWTQEAINDFFIEEFEEQVALDPEQRERERAYLEQAARDEMIGEMYAAQHSFD